MKNLAEERKWRQAEADAALALKRSLGDKIIAVARPLAEGVLTDCQAALPLLTGAANLADASKDAVLDGLVQSVVVEIVNRIAAGAAAHDHPQAIDEAYQWLKRTLESIRVQLDAVVPEHVHLIGFKVAKRPGEDKPQIALPRGVKP